MHWLKALVRWILTGLYRVELRGLEHYRQAGPRTLIIANHTSYLDGVLFYAFFPERLHFVISAEVAKIWWVRLGLFFVDYLPLDPLNPLSVKGAIRCLRGNCRVVVFPEGRITTTGSLMKVYDGPALVADHAQATVLPVHIDGAQRTYFACAEKIPRLWFPKIIMTILSPRHFALPKGVGGRERRNVAGRMFADVMTEAAFAACDYRRTVFEALLAARNIHGGRHKIVGDTEHQALTYDHVIARSFILGNVLVRLLRGEDRVGILLPSMTITLITLLALYAHGRVPVMLNYTSGSRAILAALKMARTKTVVSSRRFVAAARLESLMAQLGECAEVVYLEDIRTRLTLGHKLMGRLAAYLPHYAYRRHAGRVQPDAPAIILFTSGTEDLPKGVVLSHANILANHAQLAVRFAFVADDVVLNVLPLFHSFGITAGTLLPLLLGMKVFFYPNPLHYHRIPELAYNINATILFGTNAFLASYAQYAHPYDFYSVRFVFAGAEKLQEETVRAWMEKFGLRVLEGYGTTETAPVLAVNTPVDYRSGSVGYFLPGIQYRLQPVSGIENGRRLEVRGPNVMLGYLLSEGSGEWTVPSASGDAGWYDTGDIVSVDKDGYLWIKGRAKRFAKIGGEMVSLTVIEQLATRIWPKVGHAAISLQQDNKGERLVLYTEQQDATYGVLFRHAQIAGLSTLYVPRHIVIVDTLPRLGSGKVDYASVQRLAETA